MSLIHRLSARAHFLLSPLLAARFHHRPLSCNSPLHPLPILHHLPRRSVILATSHICSRSREALIRGGFVGDRLRPRVRQEEGLGSHQLRRATPWWRGCPHPVRRKGCFVSPLPTGSRFIAILATRGLNVSTSIASLLLLQQDLRTHPSQRNHRAYPPSGVLHRFCRSCDASRRRRHSDGGRAESRVREENYAPTRSYGQSSRLRGKFPL